MILAPGTSLIGIRFVRKDETYAVYRGTSICKFIHKDLKTKLPLLAPTNLLEWDDE